MGRVWSCPTRSKSFTPYFENFDLTQSYFHSKPVWVCFAQNVSSLLVAWVNLNKRWCHAAWVHTSAVCFPPLVEVGGAVLKWPNTHFRACKLTGLTLLTHTSHITHTHGSVGHDHPSYTGTDLIKRSDLLSTSKIQKDLFILLVSFLYSI